MKHTKEDMGIIKYKEVLVKVKDDKIFLRAVGKTYLSWLKVKIDDLEPELKILLEEKGLIKKATK